MSIITLCTDFGEKDSYVASMKGVILGINPSATIVDASHGVPAHDIRFAAFVLNGYYRYFPKSTIHVVVVDPGVGGTRSGMVVKTKDYLFVGPDNGVFTHILAQGHPACYELSRGHRASCTFHGRDVFAPAAARFSLRQDSTVLGKKIESPVRIDVSCPAVGRNGVTGEVIHIDGFGNAITNIPADLVRTRRIRGIMVKSYRITGLVGTYEQCSTATPCALIDSFGLLEIAVHEGSAHTNLGIGMGERVRVIWK